MAGKTSGTPHPQKPKIINVMAAPKIAPAIINRIKLGIVLFLIC